MLFFASLFFAAVLGLASPGVGVAQGTSENAEAKVYFEEGNRIYQEASGARGEERTLLLQRSLAAYVDSLQIVRSRNALFNAAIVLGELERRDESFNYLTEYLRIEDLSDEDRAEANARRNALRNDVAVLRVVTVPDGATVWVDRKDLAPRGETPFELALPEGSHELFVELQGFLSLERSAEAVRGETVSLTLELEAEPVPLAKPPPPPEDKRPRRIRNAAIGTAAGTLATAAAAIGVSVKARSLREDFDSAAAVYRESGDPADLQRAQDLANRTDRFNLTADVLWGTTIALGVSAIVLYGVYRGKQKREAPEVALAVSRSGGYASVKLRFGAGR